MTLVQDDALNVARAEREFPTILRHCFVAIATACYGNPPWNRQPLASIAEELVAMRGWLGTEHTPAGAAVRDGVRFVERYPELADCPSLKQVASRLKDPPAEERFRDGDAVVLYLTGHGHVDDDGVHWTVLRTTEHGPRVSVTALRTSELVDWLRATRVQHLLLLVDLCYSGLTARETWLFNRRQPAGWTGLAAAAGDEPAAVQVLTRAIGDFLTELGSGEGMRHAGSEQKYLRMGDFVEAIRRRLDAEGQTLISLFPKLPDLGSSPCLPNPHFRPRRNADVGPARRDVAIPELDTHWDPRARGVAEAGDTGWLFTGRAALMARLVEYTTGPPMTVLVTGAPGTGKSAVLARLVTLSDPDFVAKHRARVDAIPAHLRPPEGAVHAAVVADRRKLPVDMLRQLCDALAVPQSGFGRAATFEQMLGDWHTWLARRTEPVTVVVDALDEATDPYAMLTNLLERLDVSLWRRRIRLIIGIRSPRRDDATPRTARGMDSLADLAELRSRSVRLRVDEPPWWDTEDLTRYASEILTMAVDSPYRTADEALVATVAAALAARAERSFLVARIAASSLAARKQPIDPHDRAWLATIEAGVAGVFRDDLRHSLPEPPDRVRAVHLLRAVAFAYGRGLPWGDIWPRAANAVADLPDETGYTDSSIAWLLSSRIGGYLITESVDDTTVYRLFHDSIRDALRADPSALLRPES